MGEHLSTPDPEDESPGAKRKREMDALIESGLAANYHEAHHYLKRQQEAEPSEEPQDK